MRERSHFTLPWSDRKAAVFRGTLALPARPDVLDLLRRQVFREEFDALRQLGRFAGRVPLAVAHQTQHRADHHDRRQQEDVLRSSYGGDQADRAQQRHPNRHKRHGAAIYIPGHPDRARRNEGPLLARSPAFLATSRGTEVTALQKRSPAGTVYDGRRYGSHQALQGNELALQPPSPGGTLLG